LKGTTDVRWQVGDNETKPERSKTALDHPEGFCMLDKLRLDS